MVNKIFKKSILSAMLVIAGIPLSAYASNGLNQTIQNTPIIQGAIVEGSCNSIDGQIATVNNLRTYQDNLSKTINLVGKVLNTGQIQQMKAKERLLNQQLQEEALDQKKLATAEAKNKYLQQTGGANALASACSLASAAKNTLSGMADAQKVTSKAISEALKAEKPISNPLDNIDTIAKATAPELSSATILALGDRASAPTASVISAYIKNSVVPINAMSIPKKSKSPAATNYKAIANVVKTQASLATVTLGAIARHNVPTINDTLANTLWQQTGASGNPPGEVNGKISQDGLLQTITDSRYANKTFYGKIQHRGDTWEIKQMDIMMAAQLRMEEEQETMLEHAVALQAAMLASEESGRVNALNTLRGNAMAQQNSSMN